VLLGFYTAARPSIYAVSSFWTSSPTWFAIRLGILMIALSVIYVCEIVLAAWKKQPADDSRLLPATTIDPLARLGRSSLFVYWIHVELVYGYASWMWRHRLPLWGTAIACALFSVLMYRAIGWRDLAVERWRNRPRTTRRAPQAATA
jgi:succinate dehydrogenase hydrophobic anchor subunit